MKRILVCGAGGSPATNFVRSLRLIKDESFYLVGIDSGAYTLHRAETDVKLLVPPVSDPSYLGVLNQIIDEYRLEFIHIQNDYELEFISAHREEVHGKVYLPAKETVETCMSKLLSYQAWERAGIKVPRTMLVSNPDELKVAFEKLGPKVWLRDIKGAAGKGSYPTADYEEGVNWINFQKGWGHFTAAECLTEHSVTWMSIWDQGELVVAQGRKRLYWELGNRAPSGITGVTGAGVTFSDGSFDDLAIASIKAIDQSPHGIFSVDMTYDRDGVPNPTEINIGRFFTTHLFFSVAGINMPEILVKLAYGEPYQKPAKALNPLPDGLVWIRGVDFEPVLKTMDEVRQSEAELEQRRAKLIG